MMRGSDNWIFVKKNNEQNCRSIFDEKRHSRPKRTEAYTSLLKAKES